MPFELSLHRPRVGPKSILCSQFAIAMALRQFIQFLFHGSAAPLFITLANMTFQLLPHSGSHLLVEITHVSILRSQTMHLKFQFLLCLAQLGLRRILIYGSTRSFAFFAVNLGLHVQGPVRQNRMHVLAWISEEFECHLTNTTYILKIYFEGSVQQLICGFVRKGTQFSIA